GDAGADRPSVGVPLADPTLGETEAVTDLGKRSLRDVHQPVADVGGGDRAGRGDLRDTDDATLTQMHRDPAEATGVVRHSRIERIEDPGDDVVDRAGLGFVETGGHTIDIVTQVDFHLPFLAVDADFDLDRYAVGNRGERIV